MDVVDRSDIFDLNSKTESADYLGAQEMTLLKYLSIVDGRNSEGDSDNGGGNRAIKTWIESNPDQMQEDWFSLAVR